MVKSNNTRPFKKRSTSHIIVASPSQTPVASPTPSGFVDSVFSTQEKCVASTASDNSDIDKSDERSRRGGDHAGSTVVKRNRRQFKESLKQQDEKTSDSETYEKAFAISPISDDQRYSYLSKRMQA